MTDIIMTEGMISRARQMSTGKQDAYLELDPQIIDSAEFATFLSASEDTLEFESSDSDRLRIIAKNFANVVSHYWDIEAHPEDLASVRAELAAVFASAE